MNERSSGGGRFGGPRGDKGDRKDGGRGGRPRFFARRKVCSFCVQKTKAIDYKNVDLLQRFVSERGRIDPRRKTGTCARHQRMLTEALKRARHLALLPFTFDHVLESRIIRAPGR
ncbi:MAG: 30S ribosomal protein S18 [Chloroflexi bacterium]|nr:30S ribosomal protein S18 [Chloroflexota bacterium]